MLIYQNYHRHSMYTNPKMADSVVTNEDYAKRAAELGHGIISTCEHGWQGRYIEGYELAQEYNLKFVFSTEAYWVRNRSEKDRSNCHIFLAARNENGRQAINDILAEANISGFYGQPRIDIPLILSLPQDDVIVTTACLAYWKYDDIVEITKKFAEHFRYFYLEVQYHNTETQKAVNKRIQNLSLPIIFGCDSHYIYDAQAISRTDFLHSKEIIYPEEEGWFLDYPDGDEAYRRFAAQGVLSDREIKQAMENTNVFLEVESYKTPWFNMEIKMPTLYPGYSQEQKDEVYENLVWEKFSDELGKIPEEQWDLYEKEIRKEIDIVKTTKHADYFLTDYAIVKRGEQKGGVITSTGRGSGVSFYTNYLLGFTDVDRIAAEVKMYPERFMSSTRILEAKTLADLDLNLANPEVFAKAQEEIMGENHSFPMITYITLKPMAAWKMYAKSQDIPFAVSNVLSKRIQQWMHIVYSLPEEEREIVHIEDFIDTQYIDYYEQSKIYQGIISTISPHPCSYLIYQGDIRKEIGLVQIKDKLCCLMDGKWAEDYKFLKNDLLKVIVADLIDRVYRRIHIPKHRVRELIELCPPHDDVWKIYKNGNTLGVNQVEQQNTAVRAMKYAPQNITELCAFVAAIRPGFKSMYDMFERRERFSYGIKSFDALIQTPDMPNTFVLYQEMAMATLNYAGIPMSECYEIIKNIAKKRPEKVLKYKEQFLEGFSNKDGQASKDIALKVWQILEDSTSYSFNASHSYCVAIDSLYTAYLKAHYPIYFYEVFLIVLNEKAQKDRMNAVRKEAEKYYGITFPPFRFGQDNRRIVADVANNSITNTLQAIKGFNHVICSMLYMAAKLEIKSFMQLLRFLTDSKISLAKIELLVMIGYFESFGNIAELTCMLEIFELLKGGTAKRISLDKIPDENFQAIFYKYSKSSVGKKSIQVKDTDMNSILNECEQHIKAKHIPDISMYQKIKNQQELLGHIDIVTGKQEDRFKLIVQNIVPLRDTGKVWGYMMTLRSLGSGKINNMNIYANVFNSCPLQTLDLIEINSSSYYANKNTGRHYLQNYTKLECCRL